MLSLLKTCTLCGEGKPLDDFHRNPASRDGRHTRCAVCRNAEKRVHYKDWTPENRELHRARVIRCRYGVDLDLLHDLYEQQEGCCAICGEPGEAPAPSDKIVDRRKTLFIDHDHQTGVVRGLLCRNCNSAIGQLGDSVGRLVRAAAYLLERGGQ